ncbi:hypothetical protein GQ53DRAFT_128253 [Thozetella sp. PMI_491]|nr:hypothetical protein GQ53DRAFT_128253 [Thozetella sp. PMI_491]
MARKGGGRARTGCLTCKIRKIKCDEGKPYCTRCTSTGRKCDGYDPPRLPDSTVQPTLLPKGGFQSLNPLRDARALQFFCEVAGPALAKPFNRRVWGSVVLQCSGSEPAARHSVIAISSLYEDFHRGGKNLVQLRSNQFALAHYNAAIRALYTTKNEPLVLLVNLLFVCIESIQGNLALMLRHSQHGLQILQNVQSKYPWIQEQLGAVFRRLSILPLYFGMENFMQPPGIEDPLPDSFASFEEAAYFSEGLLVQTIQFSRLGHHYPYGMGEVILSPEFFTRQAEMKVALERWLSAFAAFKSQQHNAHESTAPRYASLIHICLCQIWVQVAHVPGEGAFDQHLDTFRRVTQYAEYMGRSIYGRNTSTATQAFTFEWGYLPPLVYVFSKCRDLATRLKALNQLQKYGPDRESCWDRNVLYIAGKRLIEFEHDVTIDSRGQPIGSVDWLAVPPVEKRTEDLTSFLPQ